MLSPTHSRMYGTGTVIAMTIIILLTLSRIRDTKSAANDSLSLSGEHGDIPKVQVYSENEAPVLDTPSKEQDTMKSPVDEAPPSPIETPSAVDAAIPPAPPALNEPKRAFVTFLEADTGTNHDDQADGTNSDNEDSYFVGMAHLPKKLFLSYD